MSSTTKIIRILALGDIHGGLSALKKGIETMKNYDFDAVVCVGDFASLRFTDPLKELENIAKIFDLLDSLEVPVYYVWGNRDLMLFDLVVRLVGVRRERALELIRRLIHHDYLYEVSRGTRYKLGFASIVSDPKIVEPNSILLVHYIDHVAKGALLHIEGHVHYGQYKDNYINLGFVYRDDLHGAEPMEGMIWLIEIRREGGRVHIDRKYVLLDRRFKEMICDLHFDEGVFIVPSKWRRCPVCYDPTKAKFVHLLIPTYGAVDRLLYGDNIG